MTEKLLNEFGQSISSLTIIPSDGGVYEVTVNGDLVYSKKRPDVTPSTKRLGTQSRPGYRLWT